MKFLYNISRISQNCNPDVNGQNKFDIYIASILFFRKKYWTEFKFLYFDNSINIVTIFGISSVKITTFPSVFGIMSVIEKNVRSFGDILDQFGRVLSTAVNPNLQISLLQMVHECTPV